MDLKLKLAYNDKKENKVIEEICDDIHKLFSYQFIKCKISTKKIRN